MKAEYDFSKARKRFPNSIRVSAPMEHRHLPKADWSFADADTGGSTHRLHPYPAKFIPQIPRTLIQALSRPGDMVADIFCGSGTTLVEALRLKRRAWGIDANPLAALISQAKTTPLRPEDVEALQVHQADCGQRLAEIDPEQRDLLAGPKRTFAPTTTPSREILDFWFEAHVAQELTALKECIQALPDGPARRLGQVSLSAIIVSVSKQDSDTRYVRAAKDIAPGETIRRYLRQLQRAMHGVESLRGTPPGQCSIHHANVLDAPDTKTFDLMICSPPYPNAYDYALYHRTRMAWLDFDSTALQRVEIGAHRKYSAKGGSRATVETFRKEFERIFVWLHGRLKLNGLACFVIGNSILNGEFVDNAGVLHDAAGAAGFVENDRAERRIAPNRTSFNPGKGEKTETILLLEKV